MVEVVIRKAQDGDRGAGRMDSLTIAGLTPIGVSGSTTQLFYENVTIAGKGFLQVEGDVFMYVDETFDASDGVLRFNADCTIIIKAKAIRGPLTIDHTGSMSRATLVLYYDTQSNWSIDLVSTMLITVVVTQLG